MAKPELFGLPPEEAYPAEEREIQRGEDDLFSLRRFLAMIDAGKSLPRIIVGQIEGDLLMLDGDHRAISAAIRGVAIPARIVRIP